MRDDLDEALVRDFPNLYRMRHGDMRDTCMCWGFPGDGWEPLIRRLSEKLEAEILKQEDTSLFYADQVKEKFGGLRFYMSADTGAMDAAIREAEAEAWKTCECCGAPGKPRGGGWIKTLCDECARKP
jgi:hypothetical protein